ncbi:MAG: hypothetical protein ABIK09_20480 [Pseudomonadota bacterium]
MNPAIAAAFAAAKLFLVPLILAQPVPGLSPCRLPERGAAVHRILIPSLGLQVALPASWSETLEEHSSVVRIDSDGDGACRLVVARHDGSDTAARIQRVHERLYLDRNLLGGTCGETRIRTLSRQDTVLFGEYERDGRSRVYGMFWSTGAAGFAALLTCPRGAPGDWRVALPLLSSIRRTAP